MKLARALLTVLILTSGAQGGDLQGRPDASGSPGGKLVAQGDALAHEGQWRAALQCYHAASVAGSSVGAFRAGELGSKLADSANGKARVLQQATALGSYYKAATNLHAEACLRLAQAFDEGTGVQADPTHAYAWLVVARRLDTNISLTILDAVAVKLDVAELEWAQTAARRWLSGNWPKQVAPELVQNDSRFKIFGVARGTTSTTVLINRKTFKEGDSGGVTPLAAAVRGAAPAAGTLELTCLKIGTDFALVKVAGESELRLLDLNVN